MALKRVWIPSPNYSSRGGSGVRLIVLHTSEGAQTYQSLGSFFGNESSQVSSHVGIDNASKGTIGEYVKRGNKAWTAAGANSVAVQAELCTPSGAASGWSRDYWLDKQEQMLRTTAAWVAEEAAYYNLPITALSPSQAQGSGRGVCQHVDLGSWGGDGHTDCGKGFPMDQVIAWAKDGGASSPGGDDMPEYVSTSTGADWTFPCDGTWRRCVFESESADSDDVFSPEGAFHIQGAKYSATLELSNCTPDGNGKNVTVYTRVVELTNDGDKVVKSGMGNEQPMTSGGTSVRDTINGSCNSGDKIRFEVAANGGGKITIEAYRLRMLFWR